MNDEIEKKQGKGCIVAAAVLFLGALGFIFLALYLRNSINNYQSAPDTPKEGDIVSVFAMMLLFCAAGLSSFATLFCLLVFYARRHWKNRVSAN